MQLHKYQASSRVLIIMAIGFLLGFVEQTYFNAITGYIFAYIFTVLIFSWILGVMAAIFLGKKKEEAMIHKSILDAEKPKHPYRYLALDYAIVAAIFIFVVRIIWLSKTLFYNS